MRGVRPGGGGEARAASPEPIAVGAVDNFAVFVLQAGSMLTTAASSHVELAGGAQACSVFRQVGSLATLGAASELAGTILASTSISMGDGVTIDGRALARDGAVAMIDDSVSSVPDCAVALSTPPTFGDVPGTTLDGRDREVSTSVSAWRVTGPTGTPPAGRSTSRPTFPTTPAAPPP